MSILPSCTCDEFQSAFGRYSERCPRHASSAKWWKQKMKEHAERMEALRVQAKSRPIHGGYPDSPTRDGGMSDMKPCPFCGIALTPNTNQEDLYVRRYGTHYGHPWNGCYLSDDEVSPSQIEEWNNRGEIVSATAPAQRQPNSETMRKSAEEDR